MLGDLKVEFMPLTFGDYMELLSKDMHNDPRNIFAMQIQGMDLDEAVALVNNAYEDKSMLLESIDDSLYHGPVPNEMTCGHCDEVFMLDPVDEGVLIRPFRPGNHVKGGEIHFG
jgi:hypothetical protein